MDSAFDYVLKIENCSREEKSGRNETKVVTCTAKEKKMESFRELYD